MALLFTPSGTIPQAGASPGHAPHTTRLPGTRSCSLHTQLHHRVSRCWPRFPRSTRPRPRRHLTSSGSARESDACPVDGSCMLGAAVSGRRSVTVDVGDRRVEHAGADPLPTATVDVPGSPFTWKAPCANSKLDGEDLRVRALRRRTPQVARGHGIPVAASEFSRLSSPAGGLPRSSESAGGHHGPVLEACRGRRGYPVRRRPAPAWTRHRCGFEVNACACTCPRRRAR